MLFGFGKVINFDQQQGIVSLADGSKHRLDQKSELYRIWLRLIKYKGPYYIESDVNGIIQNILTTDTDYVQFIHPFIDGKYEIALKYRQSNIWLDINHPRYEEIYTQLMTAIINKLKHHIVISPVGNRIVYINKVLSGT